MIEGIGERNERENKAKVLVLGTFIPDEIEVLVTNNCMPDNPKLREQSEERFNPKWFPGPLVRLESFSLEEGKLYLVVGKTNFKEYVGSRDLASLRKFGVGALSNPVSTSVAVITSDVKMIVADRSEGDAVGSLDVAGGYINPQNDFVVEKNTIDVFHAALREVGEEVFIGKRSITEEELEQTKASITDIVCLGMSYEYAGLCHPVLSFAAKTNLTSHQMNERIERTNMLPDHEIKVLVVEPVRLTNNGTFEYVMELLAKRYKNVEPDGRITIALARKWLEGKEFTKNILKTADQI